MEIYQNIMEIYQEGGQPVRAFFLVVLAFLMLALGALETIASRSQAVTDPLPSSVSTPLYWK